MNPFIWISPLLSISSFSSVALTPTPAPAWASAPDTRWTHSPAPTSAPSVTLLSPEVPGITPASAPLPFIEPHTI